MPEPREKFLKSASASDGLLCSLFDKLDEEFFSRAPSVRVAAQFGVGYDNIDVAAATRHGVQITNTPDVLTDATAEIAWALLLNAARRVSEGERIVRRGEWTGWEPGQMHGVGVTGKTLGIIGAGRIGTAVAMMSSGFRMRVLYCSRKPNAELETKLGARRVTLEELLRESDFVSLHVALNTETRRLIGADQLKLMKPTAVLVNTARGAVIDENALAEALRERRIAAAGLDVYDGEPAINPALLELENVVLCPHLGSATRETRYAMGRIAAENLVAVLTGKPPLTPVNRVD